MTSSLTPEINNDWGGKERGILPMSLRPQGHDIIRTWAFYTIVKSYYHFKDIPWRDIMISGHGQDAHGQKMSKSKNNFIVAQGVIDKYSADAFRFWAASVKLGDDLPYLEKEVLTGQKFVNKLWNASKFSLMHLEDYKGKKPKKLGLIDRWLLSKLNGIIKSSTESFKKYEYSRTKADAEKFFWHSFCDNYLEISKDRLYNPDKRGKEQREAAQYVLYNGLLNVIKLVAPIMPFITEEIYQLYFKDKEKKKSIHVSDWPKANKIDEKAERAGDVMVDIIGIVRKQKALKQLSLKAPIKELVIRCPDDLKKELEGALDDIRSTTQAEEVKFDGKTEFVSSVNDKVKVGISF